MSTIYQESNGKWRAQVYVRGVRASKTLRTKREAEIWAAQRTAEIVDDARKLPEARHTLREALEKYRDEVSPGKRGERWEVLRIDAMLASGLLPVDQPIGELQTKYIARWRDARLAVVKPGTVLRDIGLLSAVLERARREWGWIAENPAKDASKPKTPDHRDTVIKPSTVRKMLRALNHQRGPCKSSVQSVARAFLLALRTGMRAGEICGLMWDRVHDDYCILPVTKTKPRNVPLEPKSRRLIESMRGWDSEKVFGLESQSLDALFRKYRKRAGLDGFTFHDSRHTAATRLAKKLDVLTLCKMFGWSNPKQAMVYYNPTASDIAGMLSRK